MLLKQDDLLKFTSLIIDHFSDVTYFKQRGTLSTTYYKTF